MPCRKLLTPILLLACLQLSCTKYNTLAYLMVGQDIQHAGGTHSPGSSYGLHCGKHILHPSVQCFRNSARAPLDEDLPMGISIRVAGAEGVELIPYRDRMLFAADSLAVIFHNTGEVVYAQREPPTSFPVNRGSVVHRYGSLIIPADAKRITLIVTGYADPVLNESLNCDSLIFPMYRYEESNLSVWVG